MAEGNRKALAATIGILALLGFGLAAAASPKKKKGPIGDPPDCGEGKKAVWRDTAGKWECVDVRKPTCALGKKAVWANGAWVCVDIDQPPPPDCGEGKKAAWNGSEWECIEVPKPACGVGKRAVWNNGAWACVDDPAPQCQPGERAVWTRGSAGEPDHWECRPLDTPGEIDDIIKDWPEGGAFYQVRAGDQFFGTKLKISGARDFSIIYAWLRREGFLAAKEHLQLGDDAAHAWGKALAGRANYRVYALNMLLCSEFNDTCYGTWGYCGDIAIANNVCPSTHRNHPGLHGRAIRLLKQHADNIARFKSGKAMARAVTIGNPNSAGDGSSHTAANAPGGHYPALWIPRLNRQTLAERGNNANADPADVLTTEGMEWEDGSSMGLPPPFVAERGIEDFSASGFTGYGCMDMTWGA